MLGANLECTGSEMALNSEHFDFIMIMFLSTYDIVAMMLENFLAVDI